MADAAFDQMLHRARQEQQAGRLDAARHLYLLLLEQRPDMPEALFGIGMISHQLGDQTAAIEHLQRAARAAPGSALIHNCLGAVLAGASRLHEAEAALQTAIGLRFDYADTHNNLGNVRCQLGQWETAIESYRRALQLRADYLDALENLAKALLHLGRTGEAAETLTILVRHRPRDASARNNLGCALRALDRHDDAIACFQAAAEIDPASPDAHYNLGKALLDDGRIEPAIISFVRALALDPAHGPSIVNLANCHKEQGRIDEALAGYRRALAADPTNAAFHSNIVYAMWFDPANRPEDVLDEARRWERLHAAPLPARSAPHANDRSPGRRLRIGYVSPDFRRHVIGIFLHPLLKHHDSAQVEVFCYSDVTRPDELTETLRRCAHCWRDTRALSHEALARLVESDRIDILVDLTNHLANNRLLAFARRPAPIQITYLAHPATTGLSAIDYALTDAHLAPAGTSEHLYSEKLIRLPDTWLCYPPDNEDPAPQALPTRAAGGVTFLSTNTFCKVNSRVLRAWGRILQRLPGAWLRMRVDGGPENHPRILTACAESGLPIERVELIDYLPRNRFMDWLGEGDILLDTFAYNGYTSSLDALWMGVPLITLGGDCGIARAGLSILRNLGLTDLVAEDEHGYVDRAVSLASDVKRLTDLRASLRDRMRGSPLMNPARLARHIESGYRMAWRNLCAGAAAENIDVPRTDP